MRERLIELVRRAGREYAEYVTQKYAEGLRYIKDGKDIEKHEEYMARYLSENYVVALPCKFQQKLYVLPTIGNGLPDITEMKCVGFTLSFDSYVANLITDKNKLYQPCFCEFSKTVFLTKEEAEAAVTGGAE